MAVVLAIAASSSPVLATLARAANPNESRPIEFLLDLRHGTPGTPTSVTAGDFDGDGRPDLAASCPSVGKIAVYRQLPDGSFGPPLDLAVTGDPEFVVAGDVNGDGLDDLIVALSQAYAVAVLVADGTGGLVEEGRFAVGRWPTCVAVADLDRDGDLDIASGDTGANTVSVLLNTGGDGGPAAPRFAYDGSSSVAAGPSVVIPGDFDGDGVTDLVTGSDGAPAISMLPGRGDGTFEPWLDSGLDSFAQGLAAADLDGDGDLDLAGVGYGDYRLYLNDGHGSFATQPPVPTVWPETGDVTAADIDRDGDPDLLLPMFRGISPTPAGNVVAVLLNDSKGGFAAQAYVQVGYAPIGVIAHDLNGDGAVDVVTANHGQVYSPRTGYGISVLLNRGDGRLAGIESTYPAPDEMWPGIRLLERRGASPRYPPDLLLTTRRGMVTLRNLGGGRFGEPEVSFVGQLGSTLDLDGDDVTDAIVERADLTLQIYFGDRSGGFTPGPSIPSGLRYFFVHLDRDRLPDLIALSDPIVAFDNLGHGQFGAPRPIAGLDGIRGSRVQHAVDLDGDGRDELLTAAWGGAASETLQVFASRSGAAFEQVASVPLLPTGDQYERWYTVEIQSLANRAEGGRDFAVVRSRTGYSSVLVSIVRYHSDGSWELTDVQAGGVDNTTIAVGDINGDGRGDVLTASGEFGSAGFVHVMPGIAGGKLGPRQIIEFSDAVPSIAIADFDADGDMDFAVTAGREGALRVVTNAGQRGSSLGPPPRRARALSDKPVARPMSLVVGGAATDSRVSFSMRIAGPAALAVYDIGGRRVLSRELGWLGAGEHAIELPEAAALRAGVYWLRAGERGSGDVRKIVVMR